MKRKERIKTDLLRTIKENPGIRFSEILRVFEDVDPFMIIESLEELMQEGKITCEPITHPALKGEVCPIRDSNGCSM